MGRDTQVPDVFVRHSVMSQRSAQLAVPSDANTIYVSNLPAQGMDLFALAEFFGTMGPIKMDAKTGEPKIRIYRNKETGAPKGDCTIMYQDANSAQSAVRWFNGKDVDGNIINVSMAQENMKGVEVAAVGPDNTSPGPQAPVAPVAGKPWQKDGDWPCPKEGCGNVNFAFRGVCNKCGTPRPSGGAAGPSAGGAGGGRGRGAAGQAGRGGGRGGGRDGGGLFTAADWSCPLCQNMNWAKRNKCNICNTSKPGTEGGPREGRAGGFKEFDEAEAEETKRRRKEAEEQDGEMYDEFGVLKKKFRTKKEAPAAPVGGKAAWEQEDLTRKDGSDKQKEREKERERDKGRERERSQERAYDYERDFRGDRSRGRVDRDRDRSQDWKIAAAGAKGDGERSRGADRDRDRGQDWKTDERSRGGYKDEERDYERSRNGGERERDWKDSRDRGPRDSDRASGCAVSGSESAFPAAETTAAGCKAI
ncbi:hypothetical protein KFL_000060160 [Klebsormidium nitens]|uniref:Uncharacterized protein n=1 Tax=Klebsormidium nitens TaxID=105231 RepID=A0A0U9HPV1_KLENI|nr:hypothetical protein KFL_000060160 [Klebsormidium nitens]|eukprot:GAQ77951.1 hypothetical protein KFL_000060160 [Klebsormidium nitens]